MELKFRVKNQSITRTDTNIVAADSRNYLFAAFTFSEDWDGIEKTAIFKNGSEIVHMVLDENDVCKVPNALIKKGWLTISVFGGELITTNTYDLEILKSGLESEENIPEDPEEKLYLQILDKIGKKGDKIAYKDDVLTMKSGNKKIAEVPIRRQSVSLLDYGAVGDGETDCTEAIQTAIDYAGTHGTNLFIPAGEYCFSGRIFIRHPVQIIGASSDNTVLHFVGGRTMAITTHYGTEWWEESDSAICIQSNNVSITSLKLYGVVDNENSKYNGICMHWTKLGENGERNQYRAADRVYLRHVVVKGFRNDVFLFAGWQRFFQNCEFSDASDCGVKYYPLEPEYTGNWSCSGDIFMGCGFSNNAVGFYARGCYQSIMYNGVFEFNGYAIKSINNDDIQFVNCWNEANANHIVVEGNARFVGGYNITRDTVDCENGYATIEHGNDVVIFKGDSVLYHKQNGIVTRGVDIGTDLENILKNAGFYTNAQGVAKMPSLEQWQQYTQDASTVKTDVMCDGNYSVLFNVTGTDNNPEFCIEQKLTLESGKYNVSCQIMAPDRATVDAGFNVGIVYYNAQDETVGWDNYVYNLIGNDVWETASAVFTVPTGTSYVKVKFGPKQNGVVYMANPLVSSMDIAGKNNVYMRLDEQNPLQINVYNINGAVVGKITMTE